MNRSATNDIAIVGMGCRYPDADSPEELWNNVLAHRRAFRRLPDERLRLDDYHSSDRSAPDKTYGTEAAVINGFNFDRVHYRVAGNTYRSADLAHWLALDVAGQALADAGFPDGKGLPQHRSGVIIGNSLTGEFSRANIMRLRWPFVRRTLEASMLEEGWSPQDIGRLLVRMEKQYKKPFPPIGEESLAGGLSNTIAGRICNHYDLHGGGYTVDGACASSLLAVITASNAIASGDIDCALAGGVDLSLDPFEIVGFAKTGALAAREMRVYEERSAGFWPGEGCGFVVLMRYEDAREAGHRIYAVLRGWGVSSDGSGGITRPEVDGQIQALNAAYRRAGYEAGSVTFFEGHGTGTAVGDATELKTLTRALRESSSPYDYSYLASTKANIGHTKAAAGVAGLIKAAMAVAKQIIPPLANHERGHSELNNGEGRLRVLRKGRLWPTERPLRAAVSAMGFGGINTHLTLEGETSQRREQLSDAETAILASGQDTELFLLAADTAEALAERVERIAAFAARLSRAELSDLALRLESDLAQGDLRAALVAASPAELAEKLGMLSDWLGNDVHYQIDIKAGIMIASGRRSVSLGFLFPGQGSPAHLDGGALRRRFTMVEELYNSAALPEDGDGVATDVAQPAIVTASLAGMELLHQLGLRADVAVGHSLGELTALHWAGAMDAEALLRIARTRGRAMADLGSPTGAMASLGAGRQRVRSLIGDQDAVIAGFNSGRQTVVSGQREVIGSLVQRAKAVGISAVLLPVSHAFHSPLVEAAVPALAAGLAEEKFAAPTGRMISTVSGTALDAHSDVAELLCRQVTHPVRFTEAAAAAFSECDLLLEVGPGKVLSGLVAELDIPTIALDAGGPSLRGLLLAAAAAHVLALPLRRELLFGDRYGRPFDLDWQPRFFVNPCELAPLTDGSVSTFSAEEIVDDGADEAAVGTVHEADGSALSPLETLVRLIAERAELPPEAINTNDRMLSDLHLNSITVSQLVVEAARMLDLTPPATPTNFADATAQEIAAALEELAAIGGSEPQRIHAIPPGVDAWVGAFAVDLIEEAPPRPVAAVGEGAWILSAPLDYSLEDSLRAALTRAPGVRGAIICVPPKPDEDDVERFLKAAQELLHTRKPATLVLVQHGGGLASMAKTLSLEAPHIAVAVVDVPVAHPAAVDWILAEAAAADGFTEVVYDTKGRRRVPRLRSYTPQPILGAKPLNADDVLLVTGGGKGITAECAMWIAKESGVRLALFGRSDPARDAELSANLERMQTEGLQLRYYAADITDREVMTAAIGRAENDLGPVTAVLHGAGANVPRPLTALTMDDVRRTLGPKVLGLDNVLSAVRQEGLKMLISFSSIIARGGMHGEADYALANEWLTRRTEEFSDANPNCRCLSLEWSVWSGVGMGERLGAVESLLSKGITPIPPDEGVAVLRNLICSQSPEVTLVISGRFSSMPTLRFQQADLPFRRFLETTRYHVPGVELIVDCDLSLDTDPYLNEHVFRGERLLPAVVGLEAMAQAAKALMESEQTPRFENAQFQRPVVISERAPLTIRIAALKRDATTVDLVLRSAESDFQADVFTARCRFDPETPDRDDSFVERRPVEREPVAIDPASDLYGGIFFHTGRFQRVRGYRKLRAKECIAEIDTGDAGAWFGRYMPQELALGDPAVRDAVIHSILACIPHATLLPTGIDALQAYSGPAAGPVFVNARERLRNGDEFVYDVRVTNELGEVLESWDGLHLRRISDNPPDDAWVEALLGPYMERRVSELVEGSECSAVLERDTTGERRERSSRAIQHALGDSQLVRHDPNGKPEVKDGRNVSAAHAGDLTLAVAAEGPIGCDLEPVVARPAQVWRDLLGPERYQLAETLAREINEDPDLAATRVWEAGECLTKAGALAGAPLVYHSSTADGWVLFASGSLVAATYVGPLRNSSGLTALAILTRRLNESV